MNTTGLIAGIDIGTGSIKTVVIENNGKILFSKHYYYPSPTFEEIDPEIIWIAFTNALNELLYNTQFPIESIVLSSCMHTLILINDQQKNISNIIPWSDIRSKDVAAYYRDQSYAEQLYKETGTPIHAMTPFCKIAWLSKEQPELFLHTCKFISIKEWIWYRLFNKYEVDYSIAAATGMINCHDFNWNHRSLDLLNITPENLSVVVPCHHFRIYNGEQITLLKNIRIYIGSSDGCLANLGSNVLYPYQVAVTVGTSAAVRITTTEPVDDFKTMNFSYPIDKQLFICGGPLNNGGNILSWVLKVFYNIPDPDARSYQEVLTTLDTVPAGADGLVFLPYLHGERAPVWNEMATGVFFGITHKHTATHFLRAAIEGVSFAINQVLSKLNTNNTIKEIHISGGIINHPAWMQIISDITNLPVLIYSKADASAFGAALFGLAVLNTSSPSSVSLNEKVEQDPLNKIQPSQIQYKRYIKQQQIFDQLYIANSHLMN